MKKPVPRRAQTGNSSEPKQRRAAPLHPVMLLAIIVTTTCQLRTGVARDMRT